MVEVDKKNKKSKKLIIIVSLLLCILMYFIVNTIGMKDVADFKKVGQYVIFGAYEQDNNIENGKEPIEWLVLDYNVFTKQAFLVSRYGLDRQRYHDTIFFPTWRKSEIRKWMNHEFLDEAFTTTEQTAIVRAKISTPDYGDYDGGGNSTDRIFLLSREEVDKYLDDKTERQLYPTEYAQRSIKGIDHCWWWIRSPIDHPNFAACVDYDGEIVYAGVNGDFAQAWIRPAIKIDLNILKSLMKNNE